MGHLSKVAQHRHRSGSTTCRHAPDRHRRNSTTPKEQIYASAANHPPLAPKPSCGNQPTQPEPGLNDRMCASGTKNPHDNTSTMIDGIRTSPAPRRQAPALRLRPSNSWYPAAIHSRRQPSAATSRASDADEFANTGMRHRPAAASSSPLNPMYPMAMTVI